MKQTRSLKLLSIAAVAASLAVVGCSKSADPTTTLGTDQQDPGTGTGAGPDQNGTPKTPEHTQLDDRVVDYNEALRTASFKLLQSPPTLAQIRKVAGAKDQKTAYLGELDSMFADPRFTSRMIAWWKDIFRTAGGGGNGKPSRNTAATLAARVIAEGRPFTDLLTSPKNNCPTYDEGKNQFADGECNNGVPVEAGVLTNPGIQMQFYSNMAMRRTRWVQEIFVCTKFPAEYSAKAVKKGNGDYTSPWAFESIATAPVNFQDTSSVVCANCHTTMNHIAPLLGHFDENGMWSADIKVVTPSTPDPIATKMEHWLQPGEVTSWRNKQPVADLAEMGKAMAADPDIADCAVTRAYNFVMSKEDVVNDLATIPPEVLDPVVKQYSKNGMDLKKTLRALFASDDFTRF
jgi:hypothetical protein